MSEVEVKYEDGRKITTVPARTKTEQIKDLQETIRVKNARIDALLLESLPEMQAAIIAWQRKTFTRATKASVYAHTRREWVEFCRAIEEEGTPEAIGPEMADVLILFVALCDAYGINLWAEVRRKMAENVRRKWQEPDAEGVVEHVRS